MLSILGQSHAIDVLQSAHANGRLHHAYVFHGPTGVGKFTAAYHFARLLLCHQPQTDLTGRVVACDTCESCSLLTTDPAQSMPDDISTLGVTHPDFHIVTKELARYSDDRTIRERKLQNIPNEVLKTALVEPVSKAAQLKHNKVFVVDEAELLAPIGQNTLLKTLEEPPPGTYIILVTSKEDRLLVTIRSRCQRVAFAPLDHETVAQWLSERHGDLDETAKKWIIQFADGSLGQAKLAVECDLFEWAKEILSAVNAMTQGKYPAELGQTIAEYINDFAKTWVDDHANASKEAANKHAAQLVLSMIASHARKKMNSAAAQCTAGNVEDSESRVGPWTGVIEALGRTEAEFAANVNMGLACDHLVAMIYQALNDPAFDASVGSL